MYELMYPFFGQTFLKLYYVFVMILIHIIENWQKYLDTGGYDSALLTDVSIAFACINHQLLITKLNAYGVDKNSLNLLASSFEKRKLKTKTNDFYSNFNYVFNGVPQGCIICPLLCNINICELIFHTEDLDIADGIMLYTCSSDLHVSLKKAQKIYDRNIRMVL